MAFPFRNYEPNELLNEFIKLKKKVDTSISFPIKKSVIGYPCSNYFFQKERLNTEKYCASSSIDYWNSRDAIQQKEIKEFSKKYNQDLFRSIVCMSHTPAQFPIVAAGLIYKYFNSKKVFDPYAGWGDRCIAAMASNIDYVGVDCNNNLEVCYNNMIELFKDESKSNISIIFDKVENINYKNIETDLIFTSPPFWTDKEKLLEKYNNCETDYNIFMKESLLPLFNYFLKKKTIICLHLPEMMYRHLNCKCSLKIQLNTNRRKNKKKNEDYIYCWNTE